MKLGMVREKPLQMVADFILHRFLFLLCLVPLDLLHDLDGRVLNGLPNGFLHSFGKGFQGAVHRCYIFCLGLFHGLCRGRRLLFPFQLRLCDTGLLFIVALDFLERLVNLLVYLFFQPALRSLLHAIALGGGATTFSLRWALTVSVKVLICWSTASTEVDSATAATCS